MVDAAAVPGGAPPNERAVLFGRHGSLIGVLARPAQPIGAPTLVMLNSGVVHHVGPNRLYVVLARRLSAAGLGSLRFDLSGLGDSRVGGAAATPQEMADRDIGDALDFLDAEGLGGQGYVLLGLCSGADNAYRTAVLDERVVGAVLLDPDVHRTRGYYLRHYGRRLTRGETWRNVLFLRHPLIRRLLGRDEGAAEYAQAQNAMAATSVPERSIMREQLRRLVRRKARLFYLFSGGLEGRYNYRAQFLDAFPDVDFDGCLKLEFYGDSDHTFSLPDYQRRLVDAVTEWFTTTAFSTPEPTPDDQGRGE